MINIQIKTSYTHVADKFDYKDTDMEEVGMVLLRLKQIEQQLINMKFDNEFMVEKK